MMRAILLAGLLAFGCGQADVVSSDARFRVQNASRRDLKLQPLRRDGKSEAKIGPTISLAAKSKMTQELRLFPDHRESTRYVLAILDARGQRLGGVNFDGRMLKSGAKSGITIVLDNDAAYVRLGSRRQRVLLVK